MQEKQLKGVSYTTGFFILAGLALIGLAAASGAGLFLWHQITGKPVADIENSMADPAYSGTFKLIQVVGVILSMVIPAYLTARMLHYRPMRFLGFRRISLKTTFIVLALMLTALMVTSFLSDATEMIPLSDETRVSFQRMEDRYLEQVKAMVTFNSVSDFILTLLILALLPAFSEEMLFRGGLQNLLSRAMGKPMLAILIISIIFSLIHFSFFGFLTRMFLGIVLGVVYFYTQNLLYCVIGHFFNNALAVIQFYLYSLKGKDISDAAADQIPIAAGMFALPIFVYLLFQLMRNANKEEVYAQATPF